MNCPVCGGVTGINASRGDCEGVYRRRICYECDYIFYTSEYESDGSRFHEIERERNRLKREKNKEARNA